MSFIVRGIDLPKKGERYHIFIENGRMRCDKWTNTNRSYLDERYAGEINVQAIQIPKDHGDIKDVSGVVNHLEDTIRREGLDPWCEINAVLELIDDAPTILEAEEE